MSREATPRAASAATNASSQARGAGTPPDARAPAPPPAEPGLPVEHLVRDRVLLLVAFFLIWEFTLRLGIVDPFFAAMPTEIAASMFELAQVPEVRSAFFDTLTMVGVAFGIASVAGILMGAWMGLSRFAYRAFHPVATLAMSTPKMIFLPLMLVIFGIGFTSKVAYGVFSAIFFIIVNVTGGVRMVDDRLLTVVKSMGANRWERLRYVVLPGSLPAVATGLWYGIKHALLGVLIAELFVSVQGIGFWINRYSATLRVERVYAIVIALAILAIALGWIWKRIDEHMNRWRVSN